MGHFRRPITFSVRRVYGDYAARFARAVGLTPLVGAQQASRIPARTLSVVKWWRTRVLELVKWRIPPAYPTYIDYAGGEDEETARRTKKWPMLDCMPAFAVCEVEGDRGKGDADDTRTKLRSCGVKSLCPFCWSRAAVEVWRGRDRRLFGDPRLLIADDAAMNGTRPQRPDFDPELEDLPEPAPPSRVRRNDLAMIVRTAVYLLPYDSDMLAVFIDHRCSDRGTFTQKRHKNGAVVRRRRSRRSFPGRRAEHARFARAGVLCGIDAMHVGIRYGRGLAAVDAVAHRGEPLPAAGWEVEICQVMFCPLSRAGEVMVNLHVATHADADTRIGLASSTVDRVDSPARFHFMDAAAHAMRYSRFLINGTREQVVAYLDARAGHKMVTAFGKFPAP